MSPKRKTIPKSKRMAEKARRMAKALWADVRGKRSATGTSRTGEMQAVKPNPYPRCKACRRRNPPSAYLCDEHVGICASCCEYPHDDEEQDTGQVPVQGEDDENSEDDNDHHH